MAKNKRRKAMLQIFLIVGILSLLALSSTKIYAESKPFKTHIESKKTQEIDILLYHNKQ